MSEPRTIAVVGASLGGLRAVDALRRGGWSERIVVLGDEPHLPYTRPPLTKKMLVGGGGDHAAVALKMKPDELDTQWRLGVAVTGADLAAGRLDLADGSSVEFDGLVVATGVRPRRLPIDGDRLVVRTLDDSLALSERLGDGVEVVVIGAGFIGCEVAAATRARGGTAHVVTIDAEPMLMPLGPEVGAALRARHEAAGTVVHTGRTVAAIEADGDRQVVVLDDGTRLGADVVVEAVGSVPAVGWLDGNGLDLADGVLCDASLRLVGASAAVAVGDAARFPNALYGGPARRVEHWQIAGETAVRAAATLLADLGVAPEPTDPFTTVPSFWSDQGVISIRAVGSPGLGETSEVLEGDLADEAAIGYRRDGVLVGVVLIGLPRRLGHYVQLVTEALQATPA